jgi:hypothetical protein
MGRMQARSQLQGLEQQLGKLNASSRSRPVSFLRLQTGKVSLTANHSGGPKGFLQVRDDKTIA